MREGGGGDFENWACDLVDDGFDAPAPEPRLVLTGCAWVAGARPNHQPIGDLAVTLSRRL
jgi:hypothetical protein